MKFKFTNKFKKNKIVLKDSFANVFGGEISNIESIPIGTENEVAFRRNYLKADLLFDIFSFSFD